MRRLLRVSLVVWLGTAMGLSAARAATIYVLGGCSLAEAITSANIDGKADIWCEAGSGADTLVLTYNVLLSTVDDYSDGGTALPRITTEITIEGNGFTIERSTSAVDNFRIFYVQSPGILRLRQVILEGGRNAFGGGCIYVNDYSLLVLDRSVLYGCNANKGGAVYVVDSFLDVIGSTLRGNWADGGDCRGGAIGTYNGEIWIDGSTFDSNWAFCGEGLGGAISLRGRQIHANNSTFYANFAGSRGGALWIDESFLPLDVTVDLDHITFASNQIGAGGAGSSIARDTGTVTLTGSIVNDSFGTDCDGTIVDGGGNFGCGNPSVTLLGSLEDNGGPTKTHALLDGSNAIDAAGDCGFDADQRGAAREDASCDSGAYEHAACVELHLFDEVVAWTETYTSPCRILVGPDWTVDYPGGDVTLRAGREVVFANGFTAEWGCEVVVEIDPALIVP